VKVELFPDVGHPVHEVPPVGQVRGPGVVRLGGNILGLNELHGLVQVESVHAQRLVDVGSEAKGLRGGVGGGDGRACGAVERKAGIQRRS